VYAGKKKQGTADRRGQSQPSKKKERWGPDGSKGTLVPKKNYLRIGGRKSNGHSLHPH